MSSKFKTELCRYWLQGHCFKSKRCCYAHGNEDLKTKPEPVKKSCIELYGKPINEKLVNNYFIN